MVPPMMSPEEAAKANKEIKPSEAPDNKANKADLSAYLKQIKDDHKDSDDKTRINNAIAKLRPVIDPKTRDGETQMEYSAMLPDEDKAGKLKRQYFDSYDELKTEVEKYMDAVIDDEVPKAPAKLNQPQAAKEGNNNGDAAGAAGNNQGANSADDKRGSNAAGGSGGNGSANVAGAQADTTSPKAAITDAIGKVEAELNSNQVDDDVTDRAFQRTLFKDKDSFKATVEQLGKEKFIEMMYKYVDAVTTNGNSIYKNINRFLIPRLHELAGEKGVTLDTDAIEILTKEAKDGDDTWGVVDQGKVRESLDKLLDQLYPNKK